MPDIILLHNLKRKRAYLQGEIEAKECQLGCLRHDLETIDKMLLLVDSGARPSAIKGIRPHTRMESFSQGDQTRLILETLRDSPEPMTIGELAEAIAQRKGVANTTELRSRIRGTIGRLTGEGRLKKVGKPRTTRWTLPE